VKIGKLYPLPAGNGVRAIESGLSAVEEASHRLILSLLHIRMEFDLFKLFEFCLDK
jgi:hypothetical protein